MSSTQTFLKAELNTISLFPEASTLRYIWLRSKGFLGFGNYDYNLLKALDYALSAKKFTFITRLNQLATQLSDNCSKDQFARLLLICFKEEAKKTSSADLKSLKKYINRYFDEHNLNYHISISSKDIATVAQEQKNIKDRKQNRTRKFGLLVTAVFFAVFVAIPEGALPVYALGVFTAANLLYVGLPAFIISYLLFRQDIYGLLKDYFAKKKTATNNNSEIPTAHRIILNLLIAAVSLTFTCLCFNSIFNPFAAIFVQLVSNPVALSYLVPIRFAVSIFFSIIAFVANLALLRSTAFKAYNEISEYINKAKNEPGYFSAWHLVPAFIIGAIMIISQYWIYTEVLKLLQSLFSLTNNYNIIVSACMSVSSFLFGVFYVRNFLSGYDFSKKYLQSIQDLAHNLWYGSPKSEHTKLQSKYNLLNFATHVTFVAIIVAAIVNANAIGVCIMSIMGASTLLQYSGRILVGSCSFFANAISAHEEIKLPEQIAVIEQKQSSPNDHDQLLPAGTDLNRPKSYVCYLFKHRNLTPGTTELIAEEFEEQFESRVAAATA